MISGGSKNISQSQGSNKIVLNTDLHRFNMELEGVMSQIVEQINHSQSQAITDLSQRQTDMFTLASKYRVPQGFNNDSIQVWYDAKANITSIISRLKVMMHEKMTSITN